MKNKILLIFGLFILLQIILITHGFYSMSADESAHTVSAYRFLHGEENFFSIWLPFQKFILTMSLFIHSDLFWTPRIISCLFGVLALGSLMLLTNELFHNEKMIIYSGILGTFYVGILVFSVVPLLEIYFYFLLLISLTLMFYYLRTGRKKWLLIISIILMTMTRFDAWVFAGVMGIILLPKLKYKTPLLFTFIIFWILYGFIRSGDILYFAHLVSIRRLPPRMQQKVFYGFILLTFTSGTFLGLFYLGKNKIYLYLFISTFLIWLVGTNITHAFPNHNIWRITIEWNILLIPFLVLFISKIKNIYQPIIFIIILFLFGMQSIKYSIYNKPEPVQNLITTDDIKVGEVLQKTTGTILTPQIGWGWINLLVTCQKPERIIYKKQFTDEELKEANYFVMPSQVKGLIPYYFNGKWYVYKNNKGLAKN